MEWNGMKFEECEVIRMFNDKTGEIIEQWFENADDADSYEIHLNILHVHYQRYTKGELAYEEEWNEG